MSRLFPERLLITLSPARVAVGEKALGCDPGPPAEPWRGALAALQGARLDSGKVSVVLSNHFVRYALVPWSEDLASEAEETAYVRHHFLRVHGERAKAWSFRASPAPRGAPRLCSAIDTALLDELKKCFAKRLVSVQPYLMAAFNRSRGAVPASGAWLALVEPGRACVALHAKGRWHSVQNARGDWLAVLERERYRLGVAVPNVVLLHSHDAPGWKLERLAA